jgi:hypothetical protein
VTFVAGLRIDAQADRMSKLLQKFRIRSDLIGFCSELSRSRSTLRFPLAGMKNLLTASQPKCSTGELRLYEVGEMRPLKI